MPKRGVLNVVIVIVGTQNAVKPLFNSPLDRGDENN